MPVLLKDVPRGATITFRSKDPTDLTQWRGTLESRDGTYRSIQAYMDPRSYNERVRQVDPSVSSDITTLSYFLLTVDNQSTAPQTLVFAEEWLVDGSLVEVALAKQITLVVDDPSNDPQKLYAVLSEAGYGFTVTNQ